MLIGRVRSHWRRSETSLDSIERCSSCVRSSSAAAAGHAETIVVMMNSAIGASGHLLTLAAVSDCRSDTSGRYKGRVRSPLSSSFLRNLASGLDLIFVLGLCLIFWVFSCAPRVLLKVLIIRSSCHLCPSHVLHPIELQNNYLQIH
jgi:hypothetical protein